MQDYKTKAEELREQVSSTSFIPSFSLVRRTNRKRGELTFDGFLFFFSQWVERDVKEKSIVLFTKEERSKLTEEKEELESQLKELRWEEKVRPGSIWSLLHVRSSSDEPSISSCRCYVVYSRPMRLHSPKL